MTARILFISDLHLEPARQDITDTLLQFLQQNAGRCDALYVLGDLFETWIGDDDDSDLAQTVAAALRQFNAAGAEIRLLHGNRDFLLGPDYARRCGASLIEEPFILSTPWGELLLLHGDSLCRDDVDYQQFRAMVRAPAWQQEFLSQSLQARREFAARAREQSRTATAGKSMTIMDVNAAAVLDALHQSGQHTLLHGHTHRPALHDIPLATPIQGASSARRIVLGAWDHEAWYGECDAAGIRLHHFPLCPARA